MLSSGNGRHRRPRQAPAAMVTVAVTGAGIALPLLGAGAAHAADTGTWDKVAVCETGGLWSADTNNGFFGGLAITQDTWEQYGGSTYAERPDLASRSQQIAVAEHILSDLGPDAWPGCETDTGLLENTAPPMVDPGTAVTTAPSTPASTAPKTSSGPTLDPSTPALPGKPATPGAPASGAPGSPSAPGAPGGHPSAGAPTAPSVTTPVGPSGPGGAEATVPGVPGTVDPGQTPAAPGSPAVPGSGRHAKPYVPTDAELAAADQATRTQAEGVTGTTEAVGTTGSTSDYTVGRGDSLSGIASAHHVDGGWHQLYTANQSVIGQDPNLIKPGQIIDLNLG